MALKAVILDCDCYLMLMVCRQPGLSEHKLKSALADICDLQDNVYHCVDKTACCKVGT